MSERNTPGGQVHPPQFYDHMTITLHWLTAGLIVTLFALAQIWGFLPRHGAAQKDLKGLHVSFGVLLVLTVVTRLVWRSAFGRRIENKGLTGTAADAMHTLLYLLMITMIVTGLLRAWTSGQALNVFWLFSIPSPVLLPHAWHPTAALVHVCAAWTIIVLAGMHALTALFHHYALRDGVLRRMVPGWPVPEISPGPRP